MDERPATDPTPDDGPASRPLAGVLLGAAVGALVASLVTLLLTGQIGRGEGDGSAARTAAAARALLAADGSVDTSAAVAAAVLPSVVRVDRSGIGLASGGNGSGVVIAEEGLVVTNAHVVDGALALSVVTDDGRVLPAELLGADAGSDLAVLRVDADLPPLPLAPDPPVVGQQALAVGSPYGLAGTVTAGIVSAVGRPVDVATATGVQRLADVLQTDAEINPGSSGGPLVDSAGRLLGVTSAVLSGPDGEGALGIGFAIPTATVMTVVEALRDGGRVHRPSLGVTARTTTAGDRPDGVAHAVLVEAVSAGSPAAAAGIEPDDLLISAAGVALRSVDDLVVAVQRAGAGATIDIGVIRDDQPVELAVTLTAVEDHAVDDR